MSIFTVDSGIERKFCFNCVKIGYDNLSKVKSPNKDEIALMVDFRKFIQQVNKRSIES